MKDNAKNGKRNNYELHDFCIHVNVLVIISPSLVSELRSIFFLTGNVILSISLTYASHSSKYGRNVSSSHYRNGFRTSNSSSKTRGAAAPRTRITWRLS